MVVVDGSAGNEEEEEKEENGRLERASELLSLDDIVDIDQPREALEDGPARYGSIKVAQGAESWNTQIGPLRVLVDSADYESPGCKTDMAEGSAEEEQSSTAAPASPPADLRTLNTQLSPPYHHQPHLQPRLQHLQHPNMLATAVPPRHSHSMLSHQVKMEAELDGPCDVPLNLKSESHSSPGLNVGLNGNGAMCGSGISVCTKVFRVPAAE
ncbi:hypothetical protein WN55_07316 [Dufourea novaeangliae]|uniref:Uncharacterized protein n=1 Tax=Dufourea novaeangliae TaxID=178035 RepID=A0A154PS09_DUFNO|nr:hypothetical protein WN55_07316 [Dufourea novaeangliae]